VGLVIFACFLISRMPTGTLSHRSHACVDSSGRCMSFDCVALDEVPAANEIALGSKVIFPQGAYFLKDPETGERVEGIRYHSGTVTRIVTEDGVAKFSGHHNLTRDQGKMPFRAYSDEFTGLTLEQLRLAPNAIDVIMAFGISTTA
jgi:hypothetical protein